MTLFIALGALLALLSLALLTRPLWRRTRGDATAAEAVSRGLLFGIAGFVGAVALAGYAWLGTPQALNGQHAAAPTADASGDSATAEQFEAAVAKLEARLKDNPQDAEGWAMLGRLHSVLGRHAQAVPAYKQAVALRGDDASLLTDYALALAVINSRRFDGEPLALIEQALKIDPANLKALSLAGMHAFNQRDYTLALRHWEQMVRLAPNSEIVQQVQSGIDEARKLAESAPPPAGVSISGMVTLAPAVAAKARPDDTLFVFARAAEGPRMPLAILRKQVKDLPLSFTLDDSMAMTPAAKLSSASRVVVGARISARGEATPQPGDLQGFSAPVVPGATGLKIEIVDVVPTP